MYLAIQLEKHHTKEEILELYMNTAACGRGTNGVETASRLYFNKDVWDISIAEAAVLASITNKPGKYDPVSNPQNNRERALRILNKLLEQDYITQAEYEEAKAEDVYSEIQINSQTIEDSSDYSYFVDETINRVVNDLVIQKGITNAQAYNLIYRGGLSIYITQDMDLQKKMDEVFTNEDNFPPVNEDYAMKLKYSLSYTTDGNAKNFYHEEQFDTKEEAESFIATTKADLGVSQEDIDKGLAFEKTVFIPQPQAAMVVMDYHNGYVKAIAGGRGEKSGNQVFNRAIEAKRQPGSTFKILAAYLPAIDAKGYTLATGIDDVPLEIIDPNGVPFNPGNWYKGYRGLSTVREGIVWSMNILAVKTVFDIGPELSYKYLMDLGFTTVYDKISINGSTYTDITLSLPLGGLTVGVTPLELTAAYGAVANKGVYTEPIFYTRVLDHDGNILLDKQPVTRVVMKETTAYLLTDAMVEVMESGTGTSAHFDNVDMAQAGKTGTTNSTKDLWFAGYTPYYVASVWMGYDDPQEMAYVKSYHKYIWRDVMAYAHKDLPYRDFERPDGITTAEICTESGMLATDACRNDPRGPAVRTELFAVGTVPTEPCDVHKEVSICTVSGLFANEYCPKETVETQVWLQRHEPIVVDEGDEAVLDTIADYKYTLPESMIGEYCNIHGPNTQLPQEPSLDENGNPILPPEDSTNPETNVNTGQGQTPPTNTDDQ